jgi:hypothetical protein
VSPSYAGCDDSDDESFDDDDDDDDDDSIGSFSDADADPDARPPKVKGRLSRGFFDDHDLQLIIASFQASNHITDFACGALVSSLNAARSLRATLGKPVVVVTAAHVRARFKYLRQSGMCKLPLSDLIRPAPGRVSAALQLLLRDRMRDTTHMNRLVCAALQLVARLLQAGMEDNHFSHELIGIFTAVIESRQSAAFEARDAGGLTDGNKHLQRNRAALQVAVAVANGPEKCSASVQQFQRLLHDFCFSGCLLPFSNSTAAVLAAPVTLRKGCAAALAAADAERQRLPPDILVLFYLTSHWPNRCVFVGPPIEVAYTVVADAFTDAYARTVAATRANVSTAADFVTTAIQHVQTLACDGVTRSSWAAAPQRAWFGAGDLVNLYAVASVALLLCFRQSLNSRTDVRCTQWDRAFLAATVDTRANVLDYPPAAKSVALERFGGSYTYCDVLLFESVFLTIAKVMHSLGQVDTHDSYEALCLLMAQSFWATIVDDICSHFFSADSFPMLEAGGGSTRRKQLFNRATVVKAMAGNGHWIMAIWVSLDDHAMTIHEAVRWP